MTFTTLLGFAKTLHHDRQRARASEAVFIGALKQHTEENSSAELAKSLKVSRGFICDLRYGRRKVSDSLLEKLVAL